jgi:uncharacterized protein YcbK (DUF882 family)
VVRRSQHLPVALALAALCGAVARPSAARADAPAALAARAPDRAAAASAPAAAAASAPAAAAPPVGPAPAADTAGAEPAAPLRLRRVHGREVFTLTPASPEGGWDAADLAAAKECFAWREDAFRSQHDVHPRLLDLAYRAMRHFGAREVELVSGFRDGRATSRHSHGRAMDIKMPGVDVRRLADFFYRQGFVGVGIYPRSGFVHVDVRAQSYFWVDYARPGRRGRVRPILGALAHRMDAAALARGERPDAEVARAEDEERAAVESGDEVARFGRARAQRRQARRESLATRAARVGPRRRQNDTRRMTARGSRRMTAMTAPHASGV